MNLDPFILLLVIAGTVLLAGCANAVVASGTSSLGRYVSWAVFL